MYASFRARVELKRLFRVIANEFVHDINGCRKKKKRIIIINK